VTSGQLNRQLNRTEFASVVNAITAAFGDPTRRDIYLRVSEAADGLTATQVADATGLHPNVARHHLDKLVGGGYLEVGSRAASGAGRPAKVYRATGPQVPLDVNVGHDDILISLLGRALSRLGPDQAAALAEEVGLEYGRTMAAQMGDVVDGQRSFRSALHVVADALSAHGFSAHAERHGDELRIVSQHCPFGDVAIEHPVICAVDRGMVKGLLGSLYGETEVALSSSLAQGDDSCVTDIQAG
jgi:predicted ArsR family transcriptional regulator